MEEYIDKIEVGCDGCDSVFAEYLCHACGQEMCQACAEEHQCQ